MTNVSNQHKSTEKKKLGINKKIKPVNVKHFTDKLKKVNKHAACLFVNKFSLPEQAETSKDEIPDLHKVDFKYKDNVDLSSENCTAHFRHHFDSLEVNADECLAIERLSRGQAKSDNWHNARLGRLTSSNFGVISRRQADTPPEALVKTLMSYDGTKFDSASVRWGRTHERAARRVYEKEQKHKHSHFHISDSGLCVDVNYPHLGASPDGLVSCECCGEGLVEIKCPFAARLKTPFDACSETKFPCTIDTSGEIKLKRTHHYYAQVQGQMALCRRSYCDYFVWTLKGFSLERISFDSTFWEDCVHKLNSFYIRAIIPELFSDRVKRGLKLY